MKYIIFILLILFSLSAQAEPNLCPLATNADIMALTKLRSEQASIEYDLRKKSKLATEGIYFANRCLQAEPKNVACVYYRGVNRGLELETRTTKIKKELGKMVRDFVVVTQMNPSFDSGGAYLALGQVYLKAPSLPILGEYRRDLDRALGFAKTALKIAPKDTHNLKFIADVYYKRKEYGQAFEHYRQALKTAKQLKGTEEYEAYRSRVKKWTKKSKKKMAKLHHNN
jgi:tetratricopeptide (TPR) repeat protein